MILRPVPARWFELLTPRNEATRALKALADTGAVELQSHSASAETIETPELQAVLTEYRELARQYGSYWAAPPPSTPSLDPARAEAELDRLRAWARDARPVIAELEELRRERTRLHCLERLLTDAPGAVPDPALLTGAGPTLGCTLFRMPPGTWPEAVPAGVILQRIVADEEIYLLALGPVQELEVLQNTLSALNAQSIGLPEALPEDPEAAVEELRRRLESNRREEQRLADRLRDLDREHAVAEVVGMFQLLDWIATHVPGFPSSENFAWITGWTSDTDGEVIREALEAEEIRFLIRLREPPAEYEIPMLFRNPRWARPFEFFARQMGTPGGGETDPSPVVAVVAPFIFAYMFGDVGHGAVLLVTGLALRRRIPELDILVAGGAVSIVFGFLFGSVFAREDLIPALWVEPLAEPLTVLAASLGFGIAVLLIGLFLDAVQWHWMGQWSVWWRRRVGLVVAFLGLIAGFIETGFLWVAVAGFAWFVLGEAIAASEARTPAAVMQALGEFVESLFQLAVNTVSFIRIGAFALAHAGLGAAVVGLAEATGSLTGTILVMLFGNLLIIVLEGLVVAIQTTRLLLFEFFIRFLRVSGRPFRPLPPPEIPTASHGSKA